MTLLLRTMKAGKNVIFSLFEGIRDRNSKYYQAKVQKKWKCKEMRLMLETAFALRAFTNSEQLKDLCSPFDSLICTGI